MRHLLLAVLLVVASDTSLAGQAQPPPVIQLLDRYAAGEFDEVLQSLQALDDVEGARKDLERVGPDWVASAGPDQVARRRLTAATFALEFAHVRINDEWTRARALIKWGCDQLRAGPPSEGERLWQLASVALAEAARDWAVLYRRPPPVRTPAYGHLDHAVSRFPDDPRLAFADTAVLALMRATSLPPARGTAALRGPLRETFIEERTELIALLADFVDDPVVGPEAALRTGLTWLALRRVDEALSHFEHASRGDDAWVAYLAHMFGAQIQDRAGAATAAMDQYRAALDRLPDTPSASFGLAALLIESGRPDEAYQLTRQALIVPASSDPWRIYGLGDYRHYPDYVRRLRQEIAR